MAPEIDEIVKNEECADMFDILIVNALGYKCFSIKGGIENIVKKWIVSNKV